MQMLTMATLALCSLFLPNTWGSSSSSWHHEQPKDGVKFPSPRTHSIGVSTKKGITRLELKGFPETRHLVLLVKPLLFIYTIQEEGFHGSHGTYRPTVLDYH